MPISTSGINEIVKRLDALNKLQECQSKLYRLGIERSFSDGEQLSDFLEKRSQYTLYVNQAQLDLLTIIIDELKSNESGFNDGIKNLSAESEGISDTAGYLGLFATVLGILAKVINIAT